MKDRTIRFVFTLLMLLSILAFRQEVRAQATLPQNAEAPTQNGNLSGRWRVKFTLSGLGEKTLIFESSPKGAGSVLLLDTGPDNTAEADARPAVWSQVTNNRVSLSGEVELPIGTCCRETGTLIFKGKLEASNSFSGKTIFVGNTLDEENPNGFRSIAGTFTATRVPR